MYLENIIDEKLKIVLQRAENRGGREHKFPNLKHHGSKIRHKLLASKSNPTSTLYVASGGVVGCLKLQPLNSQFEKCISQPNVARFFLSAAIKIYPSGPRLSQNLKRKRSKKICGTISGRSVFAPPRPNPDIFVCAAVNFDRVTRIGV